MTQLSSGQLDLPPDHSLTALTQPSITLAGLYPRLE